ncbi:MAG: hypothetical protein KF690_07660 [Bacteroidetes bacterium]|nr:hypothetical protein [Bacteroidota bacterium]
MEPLPGDWAFVANRLMGPLALTSVPEPPTREALEDWLAGYVQTLLEEHFETLAQLMYRLDVPEARFLEALEAPGTSLRAHAVARLMVERELIRLEMRRRFGN